MKKIIFYPIISVCGLIIALVVVALGMRSPPKPPVAYPPPLKPYKHCIAGIGVVEAASKEIEISSPYDEIVSKIFVRVGDNVKKGDPLFEINHQILKDEFYEANKKEQGALIQFKEKEINRSFYDQIMDKRAVSKQVLNQVQYEYEKAKNYVEEIRSNRNIIASKIDRSTIKAPANGQILQINISQGEFTGNQSSTKPPILFGKIRPLNIRIEIDEIDAWRFQKGASATAYVRGNSSINIPLKYRYTEPFIVPKTSLSGDKNERVDTRVLEAVYELQIDDLPIYPGQIMDVYVKGLPLDEVL